MKAALSICVVIAALTGPAAQAYERHKAPAIVCPRGTTLRGAAPPAGFEQWCVRGGMRHGPWVQWYENGITRVMARFRGDRLHGPWQTFYIGGYPAGQGAYREGKLHGAFQLWHTNGALGERGRYHNNRRQGAWTFYNLSGKPEQRGRFEKDRLEGAWQILSESRRVPRIPAAKKRS